MGEFKATCFADYAAVRAVQARSSPDSGYLYLIMWAGIMVVGTALVFRNISPTDYKKLAA